jgi:formylglycine-generating enzyme required for sulfatase activity
VRHRYHEPSSPGPDCPIGVSWYDAAKYCRWLSEREGIAEEQMCYPPVAEIEKCWGGNTPLRLPADYLQRTGYRLPTEAEWEHACRAQTATAYSFGGAAGLLDRYGWYIMNAEQRTWPVGQKRPNDVGLFDMHGNVLQWCQDVYRDLGHEDVEDKEDLKNVRNTDSRSSRGGAFEVHALSARSSNRVGRPAGDRYTAIGFRPAKTLR